MCFPLIARLAATREGGASLHGMKFCASPWRMLVTVFGGAAPIGRVRHYGQTVPLGAMLPPAVRRRH
jgi:hypothetical protein